MAATEDEGGVGCDLCGAGSALDETFCLLLTDGNAVFICADCQEGRTIGDLTAYIADSGRNARGKIPEGNSER